MLTPAEKHYARVMASRRGGDLPAHAMSAYEQQLHRLRHDSARLGKIQSFAARSALKVELLPAYVPWIDGALAADSGRPDEVLTTVMVWRLDVGDVPGALDVAAYVLRHHLPLPDRYRRTAATLLVDEICDPVLAALIAGATHGVDVSHLRTLDALTAAEDMPDEVRAKLYKTVAFLLRAADPLAALDYLRRAVMLNPSVGVKRDIENLERNLRKSVPPPELPEESVIEVRPITKKTPSRTKRPAAKKR
ncbi:MAG: phage terminase small subunit [Aeromonas sp.]